MLTEEAAAAFANTEEERAHESHHGGDRCRSGNPAWQRRRSCSYLFPTFSFIPTTNDILIIRVVGKCHTQQLIELLSLLYLKSIYSIWFRISHGKNKTKKQYCNGHFRLPYFIP
jgi:hypothetical protein